MYPGAYAQTQPDKAAVIQGSTGSVLSYRALNERSNRLAHFLYDAGLRYGDHIAFFVENRLEIFEMLWACLRSGLYVTPINRHLSASEAAYIVDDCDARVLVVSANLEQGEELGTLAPQCKIKLSIGGEIPGFSGYDAALTDQPTTNIADERQGQMMLYSSGTTGRPKGVLRPLPGGRPDAGNSSAFIIQLFNMGSETIYLSPAPMYHAAPLGFANAAIQAGGTVVIMDRFDPEITLQLIERYKVTHSQWVPSMFIRLLKLPADIHTRYDLSSQRYAIHAAAPCPFEVKKKMIEWWGPIIEEYYSSTEGTGYARISSQEWLERPGSVGLPMGTPFRIFNEEGDELPPGKTGLIYGEAPGGVEVSYHKDPEKSTAARHPTNPALMTVGDVGYLDEDGYLYLTDRKSFMIISGGVNIYPQQIEDVLALHPKINDVAVVGVPNEELGEEVKAIIEPAAGNEPSDALSEELKEFVRQRLGKQLTPRSVDFVEELPRMPTGKLNKKMLRAKYWEHHPSQTQPY